MSIKDWKNGELKSLLSEAWGFKMDLNKLNEDFADKHRAAGNTLDEEEDLEEIDSKKQNESLDEMCGPEHDGAEVVIMGDEEGVVGDEAADPAERVAALMDELKDLLMQLAGGGEESMEERRGRGRADVRNQRGPPDPRQRPLEEEKIREMVRKAIREAMK